jgi:outer membrane receptor protein involved in Fe transport
VDAVFSDLGSLSVTYYNQTANNLIQQVLLQSDPPPTSQWQNVGRVKNTGVEVEGTLYVGPLQFRGQYGYSRARIDHLAPNYTGDLRVGDQALVTPKHTAGASLIALAGTGTTLTAGVTYVGSFRQYDDLARFRCFGGTGPCQPASRDYIVEFPGFVKVNATLSQKITPQVGGFVSVDNLTDNAAFEFNGPNPVTGRITTFGLQLTY